MTNKTKRPSGIFPTLTLTLLLAATVYALFLYKEKANTADDFRRNELKAYAHMQTLIAAQSAYIRKDYDRNGTLEYARFIPHLWRCIGEKNEKIDVNLLPKKTAFAIKKARSIDGYYFVHQFTKPDPQNPEKQIDLNPEKEWSALMLPSDPNNGWLTFFANQTGQIYVNHSETRQTIPVDPTTDNNWIPLYSETQLKGLQQTIEDIYRTIFSRM